MKYKVISFIVGMAFNIENKIENAINKFENNRILLRGEISIIYKCNKITMLFFFVIEFIIMSFFTVYIFCFCYVYPNNILDWFMSSCIIIGVIQFTLFLTIFLMSSIKYISLKCKWKICFNINMYFYEQF